MKTVAVTKARIKTRKSELNEPIRMRGRFCVCSVSSVCVFCLFRLFRWFCLFGRLGKQVFRRRIECSTRQNPIAASLPWLNATP